MEENEASDKMGIKNGEKKDTEERETYRGLKHESS